MDFVICNYVCAFHTFFLGKTKTIYKVKNTVSIITKLWRYWIKMNK